MYTVRIMVSGYVQGVSFRYYTRLCALRYQVTGYAKNLADGRVEIVAQGNPAGVEQVIAFAQTGPALSEVTECIVEEYSGAPDYSSFVTI